MKDEQQQKSPSTTEVAVTAEFACKDALVQRGSDGIWRGQFMPGATMDPSCIYGLFRKTAAYSEQTGEMSGLLVLWDLAIFPGMNWKTINAQFRDLVADAHTGIALIDRNHRLGGIVRVLIHFIGKGFPIAVFETEDMATAWLKSLPPREINWNRFILDLDDRIATFNDPLPHTRITNISMGLLFAASSAFSAISFLTGFPLHGIITSTLSLSIALWYRSTRANGPRVRNNHALLSVSTLAWLGFLGLNGTMAGPWAFAPIILTFLGFLMVQKRSARWYSLFVLTVAVGWMALEKSGIAPGGIEFPLANPSTAWALDSIMMLFSLACVHLCFQSEFETREKFSRYREGFTQDFRTLWASLEDISKFRRPAAQHPERLTSDLEPIYHMVQHLGEALNETAVSRQLLADLMNSLPVGVALYGENQDLRFCNEFLARKFLDESTIPTNIWAMLSPASEEMLKLHVTHFFYSPEGPIPVNVVRKTLPDGYVLILQDMRQVTSAREEREKFREEIAHKNRLASLGTMAAGLSHEINNPLTIMLGNAEAIKTSHEDQHEVAIRAEKILTNGIRIAEIVRNLKLFSRKDAGHREQFFPLKPTVEHAFQQYDNPIAKLQVSVHIDIGSHIFMHGIEAEFSAVIQNLIKNSLDAFEAIVGRKNRKIEVGATIENAFVVFNYEDNAGGMNKATQEKIFDPFFTTKEPGKGTGLGLAIVQSTVDSSGGRIAVESAMGVGTIFVIHWPSAGTTSTARQIPAVESSSTQPKGLDLKPPQAKENLKRILTVDDETEIQEILIAILGVDFDVRAASTIESAQRVLITERFDLLIVDLKMPGIPINRTPIHKLKPLAGHAKIIAFTGCDRDDPLVKTAYAEGAAGVIYKPITDATAFRADVLAALSGASEKVA